MYLMYYLELLNTQLSRYKLRRVGRKQYSHTVTDNENSKFIYS